VQSSSLRNLIKTARNAFVAVLVFGTTFALVSHLRPLLLSSRPLPGRNSASGPCAIWFVGSSTIARWSTLTRDMAPWHTENRGVAGALIGEITTRFNADPSSQHPGMLALYAGDNDLAAGGDAGEIATDIMQFVAGVRRRMPQTRIVVLGVKASPARWSLRAEQVRLDALIRDRVAALPRVSFAETGSSLLVDGELGPYFAGDGIHLNERGYRIWGGAVRLAVERAASPAQRASCARRGAAAA